MSVNRKAFPIEFLSREVFCSLRRLVDFSKVNPKKRITMKELIEDDWLTSDSQLPVVTSESTLPVCQLNPLCKSKATYSREAFIELS